MKRTDLNGNWNLTFTSPIDGTRVETLAPVPGNIEPVLVSLGLLDDYLPPDREDATEPWSLVDDWCYSTHFSYLPKKDVTQCLCFAGIDTVAEVYLNDVRVLSCENMHRTYRLNLDAFARPGENSLTVRIRSAELWARERTRDAFSFPHGASSYYDSQTYLRKARYQWGWDNAPRVLTSGIWRSVYIEEYPAEHFDEVYLYTVTVKENYVQIGADWNYLTPVRALSSHRLRISLLDGETVVKSAELPVHFTHGRSLFTLSRDEVKLWWPIDMGDAYLYTLRLEMYDGERLAATFASPFGIRSLKLDMTEEVDGENGKFQFYINGEPLFIRGTNWKPLDSLPSLADAKTREGKMLEEAKNLHCNMIRIWGGGIYEDEAFFDYCDKNGLLVWQDFMFACEIPPTDEDFLAEVSREATEIVKRYRNHPSLAVWCGDNENDLSLSWVAETNEIRPSHLTVSRKVLRDATLHHDPFRPYVPSSPYLSDRAFADHKRANARYTPVESHLYPDSVTFRKNLRALRSIFIGETGPINVNAIAPNEEIYEREKDRAARLWDTPAFAGPAVHQSDAYFTVWRQEGRRLCLDRYGRDFPFSEWKDYTIAINLACAEIFKDVIEYCRVAENKTGVIWWSLSDMWQMLFNYSVIDSDGKRKLPYHFIKRSQEALSLMAVRKDLSAHPSLYVVNDTRAAQTFTYTVTAVDKDCGTRTVKSGTHTQAPNSAENLGTLDVGDAACLILRWEINGEVHHNHFFSKTTDFDTAKRLLAFYAAEAGFHNEIEELR